MGISLVRRILAWGERLIAKLRPATLTPDGEGREGASQHERH
jgi:hypothetical protein